MSGNIEKLNDAIREYGDAQFLCGEHTADDGDYEAGALARSLKANDAMNAALAAVEQEMAELLKRPTLEEVEACVTGGWMPCEDEEQAIMTRLRCHLKRRAEKAAT